MTGHKQIAQFGINGQASTRWLHNHPELWDRNNGHKNTVAALTLEHLGCLEWKDNTNGDYEYTGKPETEFVYRGNDQMNRIYSKSLEGREIVRSITLHPKNKFHFGEGQPFYDAGIRIICLLKVQMDLSRGGWILILCMNRYNHLSKWKQDILEWGDLNEIGTNSLRKLVYLYPKELFETRIFHKEVSDGSGSHI